MVNKHEKKEKKPSKDVAEYALAEQEVKGKLASYLASAAPDDAKVGDVNAFREQMAEVILGGQIRRDAAGNWVTIDGKAVDEKALKQYFEAVYTGISAMEAADAPTGPAAQTIAMDAVRDQLEVWGLALLPKVD